jgi:bacitracin transport system permease protein
VWGLLNLIGCEFQKLKRKKFVQLTIAAAFLFPIPLTILMAKDRMAFDQLFRANVLMGDMLLLPGVLGVVASMLFFMERDNDTLKNLLAIPVSKTKILLAKFSVLLILSIVYSVAGLGATLIGGMIVGNVEGVLYRLLISVLLGIFVFIATLPVIIVIVAKNKSYIFSIIISFAYAIVGFAVTMMFDTNPEAVNSIASILPISIILKWYLRVIPVEEALSYILPFTITTPVCFGIMGIYGAVFTMVSSFFYNRTEY